MVALFRTLMVALAVGLVATACGEGRVSQCNRITTVANQLKSFEVPRNSQGLAQLADRVDRVSQEMRAVKVSDPKLQELQGRFVTMYEASGQAMRKRSNAATEKNRLAFDAAAKEVREVAATEAPLIEELNQYCDR